MNDMQVKLDTWLKLIQSEKLDENLLEDIQTNIQWWSGNLLNKVVFKLLVHLCRTAEKCDTQNYETGERIAELTKLLCSLLVEVPDGNNDNFVKILFKIARYLISLNMYEDAAEICCYLQPGNLYNPENGTVELLNKVISLWSVLINNTFVAFTAEFLNTEHYNHLKILIRHEIKITKIITYENYTKDLIVKISTYLDRIASIDKKTKKYNDFCNYILEYLTEVPLRLDKDEKYVIYYHILRIMCHIIHMTVNITDVGCTVKTFDKLFSHFNILLARDKECHLCFQQFRSLCTTLLIPIKNFVSDSAKSIQNVICCNLNIAQKYGYTGGLKQNALIIDEIVEPMFTYWEKCIEADTSMLKHLVNTDILQEITNLFININKNEFYCTQVSKECKWCPGKACTIKKDLYNVIIIKSKLLSLLCKSYIKTMSEKMQILDYAAEILEHNVKSVTNEMRGSKCKRWIQLWNICYSLVYNMGILSVHVYKKSVHLFSLLFTCIFQTNFKCLESSKDLINSVSLALNQLSVVHYNNSMYREAMTVCALYALLTYNQPDTKAFYMWTKIKQHVSKEDAKLTILECLRNDKDEIKNKMGFEVDTSKCDLIKLYSREAKSLLEAKIAFTTGVSSVLKELKKLKPSNYKYAHVIQLLGYYILDFEHDSSILEYHEEAIFNLKQDKAISMSVLCLQANLNFFIFVDKLHAIKEQTHMEMETMKFALCAPKLPEVSETKSSNVVPAYSMINVKEDSSLMPSLQKCLKKWKQLFKCDINEIIKNLEPNLILHMLITAGEYSRLYRYEDCEAEAWTLAYELASEINDYCTIIYVTGRCISLRQINYDWIAIAKELAIKHKASENEDVIDAIAIFWISLADLYFECGKCDDAKQLLKEARRLPTISFLDNISVYLLSLDVIIRHRNLYKKDMEQEKYSLYIVESLFAVRSLNESLLTKKCKNQVRYLFSYDVLFNTTINISMKINSLLSSRGISPDLVRRLKSAQRLGAVMRTAELLKALCYIDLSRSQLNDCEVKLQGLEHILNMETFQLSMNSKPIQTLSTHLITPTKFVDPVRDIQEHNSSPVLAKQVFGLPKFALHVDCDCYKCGNMSYRYLVFATTCIRAQLCVLQNQDSTALDYFHGAFKIRQKLFGEKESVLPENWPLDEIGVKRFSWQARFYIADYVQLLIDFCYFLKMNVSRQQDALDIISLAINVCRKYKLEGHPVYVFAKEFVLDTDFQPVLDSSSCLSYMVPQSCDIDITNYLQVPTDLNVCVTPVAKNRNVKKPLSVRRKGSPITWKTTSKVNKIWSDEDDDNSSPSYSARKIKPRTKLVRRILVNDLSDDITVLEDTKSRNRTGNRNSTKRKLMKDIKTSPIVSDLTQNLDFDKLDVSTTTENIDKLIDKVDSLEVDSKTSKRKSAKNTKQLTTIDYNANANQAEELYDKLNNLTIKEKTSDNADSFTLTKIEKDNSLQIPKISVINYEEKSNEIAEKQNTENASKSLVNETKTARKFFKHTKLSTKFEVYSTRTTRSSVRRKKEAE